MAKATKLTKRIVESIDPAGKEVFVWDGQLNGFGVRVKPSGVCSYLVQYRNQHGRTRRLALGQHGIITCEQARKIAAQHLAAVQAGADPSGDRHIRRTAPSMNALLDAFLVEHVSEKLKPSTARDYRSMIERLIKPKLGMLKVETVDHRKIAGLHRSLRSTPRQANYVVSILSKAFAWGELHGFPMPPGGSPTRGIERFREVKKERYLSAPELARLGQVLADAERESIEMPTVVAALRLLVFTGCRLSEILTLKWDYVDIEQECLRLPDSKTGAKVVHLNAPAMTLLTCIERVEGNPFVITGRNEGQHLVNLDKAWRRIREKGRLGDVRIHDLRHSFASVAASAGFGLPVIGALLGHTQAATTHRYTHLAGHPLKQASNAVGQRLADAMRSQGVEKKTRLGS